MDIKPETIDEYISSFDKGTQIRLELVRALIKKAAPEATEKISYAVPTFDLHGILLHFACHSTHIGIYPGPSCIAHFSKELEKYQTSKGTIKFPHDKPIPQGIITKIVRFRRKENQQKMESKRILRKCKNGHSFYKSSDCPTCPKCEAAKKPATGFMTGLAAPARRALEKAGITSVKILSGFTEKQILAMHGIGETTIPVLVRVLKQQGLSLKKEKK